jgi:hypothetical protein
MAWTYPRWMPTLTGSNCSLFRGGEIEMWILAKEGEGHFKRILVNVETGAEIRLLQSPDTGDGKVVVAAKYDRGVGFTGVSLGTFANFEEASQLFTQIAQQLNARDASSPTFEVMNSEEKYR